MKILTHPMHTGYDYELAKTGVEFFCTGDWDRTQRPLPGNWTPMSPLDGAYQGVVACSWDFFKKVSERRLPIIWVVHYDLTEGPFPRELEDRIIAAVFSSNDVSERSLFRDSSKKIVIEHSIDTKEYKGYTGDGDGVLSVGNDLSRRTEKGRQTLCEVASRVPMSLLGAGNETMPFSVGAAKDYEDLKKRYADFTAYFNPSRIVSTSMLEAMATGLPVVTMRPCNFRNLIVNSLNGFVVDTVDEAVVRLKDLLGNRNLRLKMGTAGRDTIALRFDPVRFQRQWTILLRKACGNS